MSAVLIPSFGDRHLDQSFAQIFGKPQFDSEAARQEAIDKLAKSIEQDITAALLTNESESLEIAGDMLGFMEPEAMAVILRCALRGEVDAMRSLVLMKMGESVTRTAELRADRHVEEHGPEKF
jgi:hypothetical protein